MFRNICLIGLPYSGKSVIGQKLYKHLNKGFVDTDDVIRQMYNCSLPTLIKNVGHKNFLDIESKVIKSLNFQNVVLSTGGSVIYNEESMEHLQKNLNCEMYHLFLSRKEFLLRTRDLKRRGVIINQEQSVLDLYNERMPLYDKYSDKTLSSCRDINLDIFKGEPSLPNKSDKVEYGIDNYYWNPKSPILMPPTDRL